MKKSIPPKAWAILVILSIIWGSSFILMKKGLESYSGIQLAYLRIVITSISLLPVLIYHRSKIKLAGIQKFILIGITGSGIPAVCFAIAELHISSTLAGILNGLTPFFTILTGFLFFQFKPTIYQSIGVLLGLLGAILVITGESGLTELHLNSPYSLLIVLATFCYGLNLHFIKKYFAKENPFFMGALSFFSIGAPILFLFPFTGITDVLFNHSLGIVSMGYIVVLAALGTGFALCLFYYLMQLTNPLFCSSITLFLPIVAIFWGVLVGEETQLAHIIGLVIILCSVYLINFAKEEIIVYTYEK